VIDDQAICANCAAALSGNFCSNCGQKRFVESDRRFGHLVRQLLESATDLDGRVWRTLRALMFQPGLLSREYIEGRRKRWVSPISLFLAVSVVYFLAPLHGGDLTLLFNQQVNGHMRELARAPDETLSAEQIASEGQFHAHWTSKWIETRVQQRDAKMRDATHGANGYSYHDYRVAYDAKADDVSKALIILHLPLVALVLTLIFARQHRYFAEHFIVAMHYLTFAMLALQIFVQLTGAIDWLLPPDAQLPDWLLNWTMRVLLSVYALIALRRAYGISWIASLVGSTLMVASLVWVNIYLYRAIQFAATFAIT
jgi:Protein of unknown function (DUF3667)